jgi:hypothetical protein
MKDIEQTRASSDPVDRQARQIANGERRIARGRRVLATSWFNAAVTYHSLSRTAEARWCSQRLANDAQFGEHARELLSQLR